MDLLSILSGLLVGFLGVGLPTLRMIKVIEGKWVQVFFLSLFATITLFIFMNMIVEKDYYFIGGNALGAAISSTIIAYRRKG